MKPDGMLVEPRFIVEARKGIAAKGCDDVLAQFSRTEPILASFICESLATISGKLALSGAPTPVVQGSHDDVLEVVMTCIHALRRGHYKLWKDSITGSRLAQLDPSLQKKPKRFQKKNEAPTGGPDVNWRPNSRTSFQRIP
jgi:hypothetical protein